MPMPAIQSIVVVVGVVIVADSFHGCFEMTRGEREKEREREGEGEKRDTYPLLLLLRPPIEILDACTSERASVRVRPFVALVVLWGE